MNRRYLRSHLSDQAVDRSLACNNSQELGATADLLADLAEFDARKLYRPAGYASMFAFCVGHLHRSEAAAYKRLRVARAARRFPAIFDAIAQGRLHLSGVVLLAPYLTEHAAEELLAAATNKTAKEIERLLAERFPRPDMPTRVLPISDVLTLKSVGQPQQHVLARDELTLKSVGEAQEPPAGQDELTLKSVPAPPVPPSAGARSSLKPLAPQRYALQVTIDQETHDALCHAQDLLGHELPDGDIAAVLGLALQALLYSSRSASSRRPASRGLAAGTGPRIPATSRATFGARSGSVTGDNAHS